MPRHIVIYVNTVVCLSDGLQWLSHCIVGHRSIKGAYICKHSRVRSFLFSPRRLHLGEKKYISLPSVLLGHLSGNLLYVYNTVLQLGEFLAPPLLKITNCLVLSMLSNASLFDSQLNCHSDKWQNNVQHSSAISDETLMSSKSSMEQRTIIPSLMKANTTTNKI